jgi:hypothetical protein
MDSLEKARETQLKNIQTRIGKKLDEVKEIIRTSGLSRHGEIRKMLIDKFNLGFGDATMLVHFALNSDGQSAAESSGASIDELVCELYSGPKAGLRPIHDLVMKKIESMGKFEITPKKGYFSLRRKRQFAMVGPGTRNRLEIGINMKGVAATERLIAQPAGGMCQYKVFVSSLDEVDTELLSWLKTAFETSA